MDHAWKKCSICKKDIPFDSKYYECSVSTCTGKRTGLVFCSVTCWDVHVPGARHRPDAGAIAMKAPSLRQYEKELERLESKQEHEDGIHTGPSGVKRIVVRPESRPQPVETDVLVVVSKVKKYIKDKADMNTAASVMDALTDHVIALCDRSIENAKAAGRKTVLDRDVPSPDRW
jgi:hypothetical protein